MEEASSPATAKRCLIAGIQIVRSAAYHLLRKFRLQGEAALQDGRHGHPAKLRQPVREWLETTCRQAPHTPSHVVQTALLERFGILVSIGHLNRVRAELGGSSGGGDRFTFHLGNGRVFVFKKGRLACGPPLLRLSPELRADPAVSWGRRAPSDLGFARLYGRCTRTAQWSATGLWLLPHGAVALSDGPGE